MTTSAPTKVFISYTHDSPEHEDLVLALADRLRSEGIDAQIDQYELAPPEGWVRWIHHNIEEADFVLTICTETYQRRAEGKEEPGKGRGGDREGLIIDQEIYSNGRNKKFVAVTLREADRGFIPYFLQSYQSESAETESGYDRLYRRLTNQPGVVKPVLGEPRPLSPRQRRSSSRAPGSSATDQPADRKPAEDERADHMTGLDRKQWSRVWWGASILVVMFIMFLAWWLSQHSGDVSSSEIETPPLEVMKSAELTTGFDMGVNSSEGKTDWVKREGGQITIAHPGSQTWGAVFVTVGKPTPPPHPSRDFSAYGTLTIEMKGSAGGEAAGIGIKMNTSPDDGSEVKAPVRLTKTWQTYRFPLSGLRGIDLKRLYVVAEFVFNGLQPETIYVRNIRYLTEDGSHPPATGTAMSNPQFEPRSIAQPAKASGKPLLPNPPGNRRARMPTWPDIKAGVSAKYPSVTHLELFGDFVCTNSPDPTTQIWDWSWEHAQDNAESDMCRQDAYGTEQGPQGVLYHVQIAAIFKFSQGKWQLWQYAIRRR